MIRIRSGSPDETLKIGRLLGKSLSEGDIICLSGDLGAGKTVFTKGIAAGMGVPQDAIVSPTFILIRQHDQGRIPLYHFDLYRLKDPQDILILGYEEYFYDDGVTVIEWSDRLKHLIPEKCLKIKIIIKGKTQRLLELKPSGRHYQTLTEKIDATVRH